MIVEVGVLGDGAHDIDVPGFDGRTTLREVLVALAVENVAAYEQRRRARAIDTLLDPRDPLAGLADGAVRSGGRQLPGAPAPAEVVSRVAQGFADGLVLAFVDGAPVDHLDAPLVVAAESRIRLLRLVALRGG